MISTLLSQIKTIFLVLRVSNSFSNPNAYHCPENAISLIEGQRMVRMLPPREN